MLSRLARQLENPKAPVEDGPDLVSEVTLH
jgi:hypothetical protein